MIDEIFLKNQFSALQLKGPMSKYSRFRKLHTEAFIKNIFNYMHRKLSANFTYQLYYQLVVTQNNEIFI